MKLKKKIELRFSVLFVNIRRARKDRTILTKSTEKKDRTILTKSTENRNYIFLLNSTLFLRPFLIQSDLSVENGRFRLNSAEAQIGLSYKVEQGLFRLNFFRLSFSTGGSSRKT